MKLHTKWTLPRGSMTEIRLNKTSQLDFGSRVRRTVCISGVMLTVCSIRINVIRRSSSVRVCGLMYGCVCEKQAECDWGIPARPPRPAPTPTLRQRVANSTHSSAGRSTAHWKRAQVNTAHSHWPEPLASMGGEPVLCRLIGCVRVRVPLGAPQ